MRRGEVEQGTRGGDPLPTVSAPVSDRVHSPEPPPPRHHHPVSSRVPQGPLGPTERGNNLGNSESFAILGILRMLRKTSHIASDQDFS